MSGRGWTRVVGAVRAGVTAAETTSALSRLAVAPAVRGRTAGWVRTNHAGEPVTLLEGPAAVTGLLAGLAVDDAPARSRAAVALAAGVAAVVGWYDDRDTQQQAKGFAGHLRAMARGEITSGTIKIIGVGGGAVAAAVLLATSRAARGRSARRTAGIIADAGIDAVLIAAAANVVNLLDLRPGRAAKAVILLALPAAGHGAAAVAGAALGAAPTDLAAQSMLGDCGANALGAGVGAGLAAALPVPLRVLAAAGLVGLNLASEKVSFTQVIERTDWLRRLDRLGRPDAPVPPAGQEDATSSTQPGSRP